MLDYCETHDVTDDYGNRLYTVTTVQAMPPLRSPDARVLDAESRDLPTYDTRASTDRMNALESRIAAIEYTLQRRAR